MTCGSRAWFWSMSNPAATGSLPPDVHGTVVTVGTFDGFHRGHRDLVERLVERARAASLRSVLLTFQPHPLEVLKPEAAPLLLSVGDERLEPLAETGLDYLAILPFNRELAALDAESFVITVLERRFRLRELVAGYDHGFGKGRSADTSALRAIGERRGFPVTVVEPVRMDDGRPISSTMVRAAVRDGDLSAARAALGRPYSVSGIVVHGAGRGRELGFRTLNLQTDGPRKLLPPDGVYAVEVATPDGHFGGMMNLGARPTFEDDVRTLEAHLFDASADWYGRRVRIDLLGRLRDVRKFDSVEALQAQLVADERAAREAIASSRLERAPISVDPAPGKF
jgi:riboflavin kinase / FMN adenylyltransferase